MITMMSNAVIPALASEGSADDPYKLILTEEPKPSSGSRKAAGDAAAAAAAEQAAQTEGSDTSDPYKGGGDNSDPYKGTGGDTSDPYKGTGGDAAASTGAAAAELAANAENYVPEPGAGAKYTVTVTPDNWVKIENEGGATLGLSQKSGVKIIEEDGLAFKDLNQNGSLDEYEDWRKPAEERAQNLAEQMKGEEKALMLAHGGWDGDFNRTSHCGRRIGCLSQGRRKRRRYPCDLQRRRSPCEVDKRASGSGGELLLRHSRNDLYRPQQYFGPC